MFTFLVVLVAMILGFVWVLLKAAWAIISFAFTLILPLAVVLFIDDLFGFQFYRKRVHPVVTRYISVEWSDRR